MGTITVGRENSTPIELYYEDHGVGPCIVMLAGLPLTSASWERQVAVLLQEGHRVVLIDRRGFGLSSRPTFGYDFDTLARDLSAVLNTLDLQQATLVGHSIGTGEVVRYLSAYGAKRIVNAVLLAPLQPYLLRTDDNPQGAEGDTFREMVVAAERDRISFVSAFVKKAFDAGPQAPDRPSDEQVRYACIAGFMASPKGTVACVAALLSDFRRDLAHIDVPVLVLSAGADRFLPFSSTGERLRLLVPRCKTVLIADAPHYFFWTHADLVNRAILDFIDG